MATSRSPRRLLPVALLLGVGLAVTWVGAVLIDLELRPLTTTPRFALPPLADDGLASGALPLTPADAVRMEALQPFAAQALFAGGLAVAAALLQLVLTLWGRAVARTHEMAVRRVLGPTGLQIAAPLLRAGGAMVVRGTLAAFILVGILLAGAWTTVPAGTGLTAGLDLGLALPGTLVLIGSVMLFGLLPAAVPPTRVMASLRVGGRATRRGSGGTITTVQVALSVALLYAGALQHQRSGAMAADRPAATLTRLAPAPGWTVQELAALGDPGAVVTSPGAALGLGPRGGVWTECPGCSMGGLATPLRTVDSLMVRTTPGFFRMMALETVEGRTLRWDDRGDVVVVNEAFVASGALGAGSPLGRSVQLTSNPAHTMTVVGVTRNLPVAGSLRGAALPTAYLPWPADVAPMAVDVLAPDGTGLVSATLDRRAASGIIHQTSIRAAWQQAGARTAWLSRIVVALGLLTFGVAAYGTVETTRASVRRRQLELGIRQALGATPGRLVAAVAADTTRHVLRGCLVGAILVGFVLPDAAWDGRLFAGIAVLIGVLSLAGGVIPATAATRVDPGAILRSPTS